MILFAFFTYHEIYSVCYIVLFNVAFFYLASVDQLWLVCSLRELFLSGVTFIP